MDKYVIKKLLREGLLDEDYASQQEMVTLANEVYVQMSEALAIKSFIEGTSEIRYPTINNVFYDLKKEYSALDEFTSSFRLKLEILPEYRYRGSFARMTVQSGIMAINMGSVNIEGALEKNVIPHLGEETTPELKKQMTSDIYFSIYDYSIASTILHELQHAYDSWRSRDKYTNTKRRHDFNKKHGDVAKEPSQEKMDAYNRQQHEVNARFAQAMDNVFLFDRNYGKDKSLPMGHKTMKPFNDVLADFKKTFVGYNAMPPTVQKRLINRLTKMYQEAGDGLKNQERG